MPNDFNQIIAESINIELNTSFIYLIFHKLDPEDSLFWWGLVKEEENHAALLNYAKDCLRSMEGLPRKMFVYNLETLQKINRELVSLRENFTNSPPSREVAFTTALKIEKSAYEQHFQMFMDGELDKTTEGIFRKLNNEDKDHEQRISAYMQEHGILIQA